MQTTAGAADVTAYIQKRAAQIEPRIIELRRYFHRHPELSLKEFETSASVCAELDKMGIAYRRVEGKRPQGFQEEREDFIGTGIIATIKGEALGAYDEQGNPVHRIALRTDMDALPVHELTGVEYASQEKDVMHACGHDCHMAMMLGAVQIINELRGQLKGEVRILFQPAEEVSQGARDMIAAGAIEGVEALYGAHIWSEIDAGKVSCEAGRRMGATDWFRVDIKGVSAHGSMPDKGIDAIVVACETIVALQVLVSRGVSPFEPAAITVGEIHGGTARNIMAGSAYLTGTVRTWHDKTRKETRDRLERVVGKTTHAFKSRVKFTYEEGNPSLSNDEFCAGVAQESVRQVLGEDALGSYEGTLAGEDFSEYLRYVPGVFVFLGTRNPELNATYPQHSEHYTVDESVLVKGTMLAAQWAVSMLNDLDKQQPA